jgi:hypothetical protein
MSSRVLVDENLVRSLARMAAMEIAPRHMPGVIANLETLLAQADLLFAEPLDPLVEPAPVYRP